MRRRRDRLNATIKVTGTLHHGTRAHYRNFIRKCRAAPRRRFKLILPPRTPTLIHNGGKP